MQAARKEPSSSSLCLCGSGVAFGACCRPLLRGGEAANAEALMRSRFTAFALGAVDHLWRTLHPRHSDRAQARNDVERALAHVCRTTRFQGLRITATTPVDVDGIATVSFTVRAFVDGKDAGFAERSRFAVAEGGWRYLDGDVDA
jgi:SEC-C motif-containing protein